MYKLAILKNETLLDHLPWVNACNKYPGVINYDVIDITQNSWFEKVTGKDYDMFLLRPPGRLERFKKLYDERVFVLSQVLGRNVYPSTVETLIYENKRLLRDWLQANNIPHPESFIFFNEDEAVRYAEYCNNFPVVAKTNMGASGNGVIFINSKTELVNYIKKAFTYGNKSKSGFKLFKGSIFKKVKKLYSNKNFLKQRLDDYKLMADEVEKGIVFFQEFIPHLFEWRCVRIGDSFFAHKKLAKNNMSSGTLLKGYDPVPESLLAFIKEITDRAKLYSTSIDIFEKGEHYLVNEIQCFFGQSDPYQMLVNDKPGRYRLIKEKWHFEEGDFARNSCYDLRLEHAISLLSTQ